MAKKKKISVVMDGDEVSSIEIDGRKYTSPEDIVNLEDRRKVERMMANAVDSEDEDTADNSDSDASFDNFFSEEEKEQFRQLDRDAKKFPPLIAGIFGLVSAITLIIALISGVGAYRQQSAELSAPGMVVNTVVRTSTDSETGDWTDYSHPVVSFDAANGRHYEIELAEGSYPPEYLTGDSVTILYNPERPQQARIQSSTSTMLLWLLPAITGTVGLAFLGAGLMVYKLLMPSKEESLPEGVKAT